MNAKHPEPLTPEERELAALLGRAGAPGEPSPALDAKILAAARAAAAPPSPAHRPRWPWFTGVAASVLLAAGIAWQLRPPQAALPGAASDAPPAVAARDAAEPRTAAPPAAPESATSAAAATVPAAAHTSQPAAQARAKAAVAERKQDEPASPAPEDARAGKAAAAPPADEADRIAAFGTAAPLPSRPTPPAPPAPPPPAVPPLPAPADAAAGQAMPRQALRTPALAEYRMQRQQQAPPPSATTDEAAAALAAVPVADDAGLSKKRWLQRIRQRLAEGDADDARASLRLFVEEHPHARVPQDLQALLEE